MAKEHKSNNSIAINVTRRTAIIFLVTLLVLLAGTYLIVSSIIRKNTEKMSEQLVTLLADDIKTQSEKAGVPISTEYPEISIKNGNYICDSFDIDFAFVLVPEPEENKSTYISVSYKDKSMEKHFPNHYIGHVSYGEYSQNEWDLWNGKEQYSHIVVNKSFGHEMITETLITDSFGNRVSVGVDVSNKEVYEDIFKYFILIGILLLVIIFVINLGLYYVIKNQVSDPAKRLSIVMQSFVANGEHNKLTLGEMKASEYEMIADAFDSMSTNIRNYISSIETLTRESERQQTELDIASRIQQGILPKGRYSSENYAVSAMMHPAREVGGDLYDYIALDENKALIVIADVSGKGIAAALFMAVTLILMRQFAKMGLDPESILESTNAALVSNNPSLLFVTAFIGIYDREKGTFSYSNAGHCPGYIVGDRIKKLSGGAGVILGVYEDEKYSCAEEKMVSGETVFLYTDGVTEAMNNKKEMFGEHRLENALESYKESKVSDIIVHVRNAVDAFTAQAEQHDDITMISLNVK